MAELSKKQSCIAFLAVTMAKKTGGEVPTARQIADLLDEKSGVGSTGVREANRILKVLEGTFFNGSGRSRELKSDEVVTETPTAVYFCELAKSEDENDQFVVDVKEFQRKLAKSRPKDFTAKTMDFILDRLLTTGYLEEVPAMPRQSVRITRKGRHQYYYLRLLAGEITISGKTMRLVME